MVSASELTVIANEDVDGMIRTKWHGTVGGYLQDDMNEVRVSTQSMWDVEAVRVCSRRNRRENRREDTTPVRIIPKVL